MRAAAGLAAMTPRAAPPELLTGSPGAPDLSELWQAAYANPDDLDVRRVLADALTAAEDPRGEFIALQLSTDPKAGRRASALLDAHLDAWTPAIPGIERASRVFTGGFLTGLRVGTLAGPVLGLPEWRMVERLTLGAFAGMEALVAGMPRLRALGLTRSMPPREMQSTSLEVLATPHGQGWRPAAPAHFHGFPNLRLVITGVRYYDWSRERWAAWLGAAASLRAIGIVTEQTVLVETIAAWREGPGP